jgi:1-acyl-sn-glycerol-3-phosphate acyltransferase
MNKCVAALRSAFFYLGYGLSLVWFSLSGLLLSLLLPRNICNRYILYWNRFLIRWLAITCGLRVKVYGAENIPRRPFVALSKHQSQWETYFLQYYLAPVSIVLKQELLFLPFFGWGLKLTQPIAIDRGSPKQALRQTLEQGVQRLADGVSVLIFPEGTRVEIGNTSKFARGGTNIAIKAAAPILPIALNAGQFWPPDTFIKYPGTISVVIGKPIEAANGDSRELTERVQLWIEKELARISGNDAV